MVLKVRCKCGKGLKIPAELAGKKLACPACKKPFRIPLERFEKAEAASKAAPPPIPDLSKEKPQTSFNDVKPEQLDLLSELSLVETTAQSSGAGEQAGYSLRTDSVDDLLETAPRVSKAPGSGPVCPSCHQTLASGAKVCVQCGINLATGRSLLTAEDGHLDTAHTIAETTIKWVSWLAPFGVYPIASEAYGNHKPWVVRSVAILTIFTSVIFWGYEWSSSPKMQSMKNMLLWCGDKQPSAPMLYVQYLLTPYGDQEAFLNKLAELGGEPEDENEELSDASTEEESIEDAEEDSAEREDAVAKDSAELIAEEEPIVDESAEPLSEDEAELAAALELAPGDYERILAAHNSLTPHQQCIGQFHAYQLLTNAFLHADIWHLLGNLLFLMVLGARVNSLLGQTYAAILYPLLAIIASLAFLISMADGPITPALGASGAIMGFAGMYLVLFPVHQVHMAAWIRWGLIYRFHLSLRTFSLRGFWVVLFYIAFDVVYTVFNIEDNVAHWAHLGGFIGGAIIASILLFTRLVNARGGDLFSCILGKHAWALVGKPRN